ncbi:hypothetical protein AAG570_000329 [Ranatra chinensis]|uniref:Presequence protease, mitochondrial n=1 Tax=Ranatra chinensis TaxID=642074 RepID=A0ABD0Z763_9HEMI
MLLTRVGSFRRLTTSVSQRSRVEIARRSKNDKELCPGNEIEGFVVTEVGIISEFDMTAIRLKHQVTGAQYLHLMRDDNNNAFSVGFRTTPTDSTGLPHILEHTTLCGSRKYPCRDPFFKMLNRSMATFMNAMTGPDYTIYPFSTQNQTDFYNLMSVYLDAVFKPQLRECDFRQEGWRLEHTDVHNKESPIIFKGVVFNEMKGVFSENHSIFSEALLNNILPSNTYGVISGGDPTTIPTLSYQDLKRFHEKCYHPSNCRFFSYGNFPLKDHLSFINKSYLQEFTNFADYSKGTLVPSEERWDKERTKYILCRYDPLLAKEQSWIAISQLCNDVKSCQETFVLQVLSELLVKGPNASFYKSLVEPNIAGGFCPVTGYDAHTRDTIFSVGLQGVDPEDFEMIVETYHKTLDNLMDKGFEENNINAVLHNIELSIRHQMSDFGLSMLFGITPLWNHDGDVIRAMRINEQVSKFKSLLAENPLYLQDCVQEYLKENKHRLILIMNPDPDYEEKMALKESKLLKEKLSNLSSDQLDMVFVQGQELLKEQEAKQDISCLPTLRLSDLKPDCERTSLTGCSVSGVPLQICKIPTNGLVYFRGVLNTAILSEEAKGCLPLFCSVFTRMGTSKYDYKKMDQLIHLKTGGLHLTTHIAENIYDTHTFEEGIAFSSFCLEKNLKPMLHLWGDLLNNADLNNMKRFETLLKNTAVDLVNGLMDHGHEYAQITAASFVSPSAKLKEHLDGISYVRRMKHLSSEADLTGTLQMIKNIAGVIMSKSHMRLALNLPTESDSKAVETFLDSLKGTYESSLVLSEQKTHKDCTSAIHYVINIPVNFAAMAVPTVNYTHNDFPVREKGGAYGAGARINSHGVFSFFSYRDPNPLDTFDIFQGAQEWIMSNDFTNQDIDEAKLGVFQSIDAPVPPGSRGNRNFFYGITDDEIQRHRKIIMNIKHDDILDVASYLNPPCQGRALLGPSNKHILERKNENWDIRRLE